MATTTELRTSRSTISASSYIPTLDGWRAVAIGMVLICHQWSTLKQFDINHGGWKKAIGYGWYGVNIFFAISGFLICSRLLLEREATGRTDLRAFYVRRAFRILPLCIVFLGGLVLLAGFAELDVSAGEIVSSIFFWRNYYVADDFTYTAHFWSLSVEEHFYLTWPFAFAFLSPRRTMWFSVAAAMMVQVWRMLDTRLLLVSSDETPWWMRTECRIDGMLWGCVAAIAVYLYPTLKMPRWSPLPVVMAFAYVIEFGVPLRPMIMAILCPLMIVSTVQNPTTWIGRLLELPAVRWVGRLSYSLYVVQPLRRAGSISAFHEDRPGVGPGNPSIPDQYHRHVRRCDRLPLSDRAADGSPGEAAVATSGTVDATELRDLRRSRRVNIRCDHEFGRHSPTSRTIEITLVHQESF